ncbi:hypothetical protein [Sinorhizobium psoraleae]|uniref:Uncharacterized protein n=1 Tax=Sinorhizobium psoraleae TaxID=520838 RepID=A0ABT4KNZ3_9HYPH|nr:hypothetical protein [Sinorhizobium psoraleae]MCZ4093698.1 hypothetical protein [Sinorhizobium psoraleae]
MRRCFVRVSVDGAFHAAGKIMGKLKEPTAIDCWTCSRERGELLDLAFERAHTLKRIIPPRLQLACDMPLGRIHQLVPAPGERRLVPRAFKFSLNCGDDVSPRPLDLIGGEDRRLDSAVRDRFQNLGCDCAIDSYATNTNAQADTDVRVVAAALVTVGVALRTAVEIHASFCRSVRSASAPSAGRAAARRFARAVLLHVRVLKQKLLILFILLPTDKAAMIVAQQNVPLIPGLAQPVGLGARPSTISVRCARLPKA